MASAMIKLSLHKKSLYFLNISKRHVASAIYVLLPEIPQDTAETNTLMRVHEPPSFSKINPHSVVTGCAKLSIEYDVDMAKHFDNIKDSNAEHSFRALFEPVESLSVPLNYAWRTARHLSYVGDSEVYRGAFQRIHPQVQKATINRFVNPTFHGAVQKLAQRRDDLTEYQNRFVDKFLFDSRLYGMGMDEPSKKTLYQRIQTLSENKNHFRNRVMLTHNMYSEKIELFSHVSPLPKQVATQMSKNKVDPSIGPWHVTLDQQIYGPFMEYCEQRVLRENAWTAYRNRASQLKHHPVMLSNHHLIGDIRRIRMEIANSLGFENYSQMTMETKMAGSVDNVLNMIESMKNKFYPVAVNEVAVLQDFAESTGFTEQLQLWDIPYYRRLHKEHTYSIDDSDISSYFTLENTTNAMFKLCGDLFDVEFKEVTEQTDRWHKTVQVYELYDKTDNKYLATFYIDPFPRAGKIEGWWTDVGREHSTLMGTQPITYMNLDVQAPLPGQPAFLSIDQVAKLFNEFGHALQQMLTTVPYSELSGQRNIEWDASQVCANFMAMLACNPHVLKTISSHYQMHEPLPDAMLKKGLDARRHMKAFDMVYKLYVSAYDMEMHINPVNTSNWHTAMTDLWPQYVPMPLNQSDYHPCSLISVFSDEYASAYYSHVWSEMIAADIYSEFNNTGLENREKVAAIGKRFRDTFLSYGGGVPAIEVFRRFKGHDPSQDAIFKYYGV